MPVSKRIKALLGFSRAPDRDVHVRGLRLYDGLKDNPNFPKPPVDLEVFKAALDGFGALIAESMHRDRRVIAEKNKQRDKVTSMITEIGHYVEAVAQEDLAVFLSSGLDPGPTTPTSSQPLPLPVPKILNIEQGYYSGELDAYITPLGRKALYYELRCTEIDGIGMPGIATITRLTNARAGKTVKGLTPGVTYAFQVRAFGKAGFTDWSDSVTRMCI